MDLTSTASHDPAPVPPTAPDDSACCGSGCDPCIWDWYQQERERYRVELVAWQARQSAGQPSSSPAACTAQDDDSEPARPGIA